MSYSALKLKGYLVISGCPRSGTSVNMKIQQVVHGDDAIIGEEFPQENRKKMREMMLEQQEGEPDHQWQIRRYHMEKHMAEEEKRMSKEEREFRDMNPDGFWEMAFTCVGITPYQTMGNGPAQYSPQLQELLDEVENGAFRVVKVVSQGLAPSNPKYIGKIIYSIRHPRAVAKSQERLVRGFDYTDPQTGEVKNCFHNIVIHTPEMFIQVTTQAARFLLANPRIPVRFFHFEDLVSKPKEVIDDIAEFVGQGDYSKAYDVVKPKLNRSKHENVHNELWEDAEFVYEHFCKAAEIINECPSDHWATVRKYRKKAAPELMKILEYMSNPKINTHRQKRNWRCFRAKHIVTENMCKACYERTSTAKNFLLHSESIPGEIAKHWTEEPCLFECGMDLDREEPYLTIEESIENNWWKEIEVSDEEIQAVIAEREARLNPLGIQQDE